MNKVLVAPITVYLITLILWVWTELPESVLQVCFNVLSHVLQKCDALPNRDVFYCCGGMSGVDGVGTFWILTIVVDDSTTRVPVLFCRAARDTVEIHPAEKLLNGEGCPSWTTYHPASFHFFPYCFPQDRLSVGTG